MATIELKPFNVAPNEGDLNGYEPFEPVALVGGGDLTDDLDASYIEIGAWLDSDGTQWFERVSCDFVVPAGFDPAACLLRMRARNSADVLSAPPANSRNFLQALAEVETGAILDSQQPYAGALEPFANAEAAEPTWVTWYYNTATAPDLNNPTDAGGWFDLNAYSSAKVALTGAGLRVTLGFYWIGEEPYDRRRAWIDLFEFRLVVSDGIVDATRRYLRPQRHSQRGDGFNMSSAPRHVQGRTRQSTNRNFGIR